MTDVFTIAAKITIGRPVLGAVFSAGAYTPAVNETGHAFAVLHRTGAPVYLAHDAFEAARAFEAAEGDPERFDPRWPAVEQRRDSDEAARALWERWLYDYRFRDGFQEPPCPR